MIRTAHHIHFQLLKAFPAHRILTHFLRNCFSFHTSDNSHDILFTFHINVRCRLVEDIPGSNVTVIAVAITPQNIFFNFYIFILFLRLVNVTQVLGSRFRTGTISVFSEAVSFFFSHFSGFSGCFICGTDYREFLSCTVCIFHYLPIIGADI